MAWRSASLRPARAAAPTIPKARAAWLGHAGDAYGLRSGLWIDRKRGVGIAYFVTGLPDAPPPGRSGFRAAEETMLKRSVSLRPQRP